MGVWLTVTVLLFSMVSIVSGFFVIFKRRKVFAKKEEVCEERIVESKLLWSDETASDKNKS